MFNDSQYKNNKKGDQQPCLWIWKRTNDDDNDDDDIILGLDVYCPSFIYIYINHRLAQRKWIIKYATTNLLLVRYCIFRRNNLILLLLASISSVRSSSSSILLLVRITLEHHTVHVQYSLYTLALCKPPG